MPAAPRLAGALIRAGGALKLVPLALLAVVPLTLARWRDRLSAWGSALAVMAYAIGLSQRSGHDPGLAAPAGGAFRVRNSKCSHDLNRKEHTERKEWPGFFAFRPRLCDLYVLCG